mmetsp:Transcript_44766/g.112580  ORF Transcript_44766/g.112580 Transcript_44766/m.112580 type:complete len:103 (+) Transcript_44766:940-1248(+)
MAEQHGLQLASPGAMAVVMSPDLGSTIKCTMSNLGEACCQQRTGHLPNGSLGNAVQQLRCGPVRQTIVEYSLHLWRQRRWPCLQIEDAWSSLQTSALTRAVY